MEIRLLRESDERTSFRSGDDDLDRYFRKFAGQNQFKHHVGVSYVAVHENEVLGFATVTPGHIEIESLPAASRKKLPQYPLPVLRLARLAVHEAASGQGIGTALLKYVLDLALRLAEDFGCVGVVVDAKPRAVEFYAKYGFIILDAVEGQADAKPTPTPMFLALRAIAAGRGSR